VSSFLYVQTTAPEALVDTLFYSTDLFFCGPQDTAPGWPVGAPVTGPTDGCQPVNCSGEGLPSAKTSA